MRTRTWIAGIASASLAATAAVVAIGSGATVANALIAPTEAGRIVMATTYGTVGTGSFTYFKASNTTTTPDATQTFSIEKPTKCKLSYPTPAEVVSVSSDAAPSASYPGFQYGGLGVASGKVNGRACSQVTSPAGGENQETLFLTLNGTKAVGDYGPPVAYNGQLDVELSGSAVVRADLWRSGQIAKTYYAVSGGAASPGTVTNTKSCSIASDSGPNSTSGDNCIWNFGPTSVGTAATSDFFDMIQLTPMAGAFSLEGGSDWGAAADSSRTVFKVASLPSAEVNCGGRGHVDSSPTQPGYTYWRLDNGSEPCVSVGVGFVTTSNSFAVYKKAGFQTSAQWRIRIEKYVSAATNPVPALKIDWEDGVTPKPITYCDNSYYNGTSSTYTVTGETSPPTFTDGPFPVIVYSTMFSTATDQSSKAGFQLSCLYQNSSLLQDGGTTLTVDDIYLTGDWKASF